MTLPLFDTDADTGADAGAGRREVLAPGAVVLRGRVRPEAATLWAQIEEVVRCAPWRRMVTPGGRRMSVAMTNCGPWGWVSDEHGYRYSAVDPLTGGAWPPLPASLHEMAREAAAEAGYAGFAPDACLVNGYEAGNALSLHQDRDERDMNQPIVSVSLGVPAVFLFGGLRRSDPVQRVPLHHGDVVVWGGASRLRYHGVARLRENEHPLLGPRRVNLTLRRAR